MTNNEALTNAIKSLTENFQYSISQTQSEINDSIVRLDIINTISSVINDSPISEVLHEVQNDLLNSLIFCLQCYYRPANICLRSAIELLLSFLYYYDNQYDFILWRNDKIDMSWAKLTDSERGVFNEQFLNLVYGKTLKVTTLAYDIKRLYHTTSQFVHGKYDFMQRVITDNVKYSKKQVDAFFAIRKEIEELSCILLYIRFHDILDSNLDPEYTLELKRLTKKYEVNNHE